MRDVAPPLSDAGLVVLGAGVLTAGWSHRRSVEHLSRLGTGVLAAGGAYLTSEVVKLLTAQPRPCHVLGSAVARGHCPPAGDWSLPSNHAVLAVGLATALALVAPRTARWTVPTALLVIVSRVAAGVHYPHDVMTGALLALALVVTVVAVLDKRALQMVRRVVGSRLVPRPLGTVHRVR